MSVQADIFMGSPALKLSHAGSEARVLLHGAQVMSWKPAGYGEQLFSSEQADYAPMAAIRGGIPLCFPQFGLMGDLPMHGFIRNQVWEHAENFSREDATGVTLRLRETPPTLALWPHAFTTELSLTLRGESLCVDVAVINTGVSAFSFRYALHTYLRVPHIEATRITGLAGMTLHDKVANIHASAIGDSLCITGFTEQIYATKGSPLTVHTPECMLEVASRNMPDAVIWNPWAERSAQIADFPDDGYQSMLCLEAAVIDAPVMLSVGERWEGGQSLTMHPACN